MRPVVRVLIVTDSNGGFLQWRDQSAAQAVGTHPRHFHLGEFISVLSATSWLGFNVEITKVHREAAAQGQSDADFKAQVGADVVNFRFDQPFTVNGATRTLASYDMALFFAIATGNANPALASEAAAVAQFMENGGGFFATGDHQNLGGTLCSQLPRVRSMRRWYFQGPFDAESPAGPAGEPGAPPALGPHRHDTTRPGLDMIVQFEDQSDEVPQEIQPALYAAGIGVRGGYLARRYLPHPLLCSPDGMVRWLPDHMHEGTCEVPGNLGARTFTLGAATVREYPDYVPPTPPPGYVAEPLAPEIVATGTVVAGTTSPAIDTADHTGSADPAIGITFGVIAAWDGQRVGKGRVVVDSTWHHFFNINLTGDRFLEKFTLAANQQQKLHGFYVPDGMGGRMPSAEYKMIMWYFRNIVYWLIPASRHAGIWWRSIADIQQTSRFAEEISSLAETRNYRELNLDHYLYFGQLAESYLSKARGACAALMIQRILYKPKIPWWEWIENVVDIWDPVRRQRQNGDDARQQKLGIQGVGPRIDVAIAVGLGAAVVTAAIVQSDLRQQEADPALKAVDGVWAEVFAHAVGAYGKSLAEGAEAQRAVRKVVAAQVERGG